MTDRARLHKLLAPLDGRASFRVDVAEKKSFQDVAEIRGALEKLELHDGWLSTSDRHRNFFGPEKLSLAGAWPLCGEFRLASDPNRSIHFRQVRDWEWIELHRVDDGDAVGFQHQYMLEGEKIQSSRRISYEVSWRLETSAAGYEVLVPWRTRFAGFLEGEGE